MTDDQMYDRLNCSQILAKPMVVAECENDTDGFDPQKLIELLDKTPKGVIEIHAVNPFRDSLFSENLRYVPISMTPLSPFSARFREYLDAANRGYSPGAPSVPLGATILVKVKGGTPGIYVEWLEGRDEPKKYSVGVSFYQIQEEPEFLEWQCRQSRLTR